MSIILDALNKAESDKALADAGSSVPTIGEVPPTSAPTPAPFSTPNNSRLALYLLPILVGLLGGVLYMRVIKPRLEARAQLLAPAATPSPTVQTAVTAPASQPSDDVSLLREKAMVAFQAGDYESSRTFWEKLSSINATDPEIYNNLGVVYKKLTKKDEAREAYRKALELRPDYAEALNNYGVLFLEDQENDKARELFTKAMITNPSYPDPYFHLALLDESVGDVSNALQKYQTFLDKSPNLNQRLKAQIEMRMASLKGQ